jgi:uncharacterized protein
MRLLTAPITVSFRLSVKRLVLVKLLDRYEVNNYMLYFMKAIKIIQINKTILIVLAILLSQSVSLCSEMYSEADLPDAADSLFIGSPLIDNPAQVFIDIVKQYRLFVSPVKQMNCRMYPTCSLYGLESLEKHKLKGVLMIIDRLNRCGHDLEWYDAVLSEDCIKYLDEP